MHRSYGYHHSGSSFLLNTLFLLSICAIAGCLFYGRGYDEPDVVVIQQGPGGVQQGYAIGPNGQPIPMQGQQGVTVINAGRCSAHYSHKGAKKR